MNESDKIKAQLVIVTGLVILYFVFKSQYFLIAAAVVGVVSIALPVAGDLLVKGWYKIAEILGAINGRILLSAVFFLILFPVAIIARLGKKDLLALKRNNDADSVFVERNHKYTKKDLEQVW